VGDYLSFKQHLPTSLSPKMSPSRPAVLILALDGNRPKRALGFWVLESADNFDTMLNLSRNLEHAVDEARNNYLHPLKIQSFGSAKANFGELLRQLFYLSIYSYICCTLVQNKISVYIVTWLNTLRDDPWPWKCSIIRTTDLVPMAKAQRCFSPYIDAYTNLVVHAFWITGHLHTGRRERPVN
jgi:hypothetical protein